MVDYKLLRLGTALVFIGGVLFTVVSEFVHPQGGDTVEATFANYAASSDWTAIHLGEFVSTAVVLAGLLILLFALNVRKGAARWLGFFGAMAAGVALALAGVLYAVDGVANKQALNAWVSAPPGEQATSFASAEALRWVEMGITSYQDFMFGLALVLLAIVIVWTARVPRPIGSLMGVSGLAIIVFGWLVGTNGFTAANNVPSDAGYTFLFAAMIWLLLLAWRRKESSQSALA